MDRYGSAEIGAAADQRLDDKTITLAVETELAIDPQVSAHLIDVQTANGVVILSGFVDHVLARERAHQQTERIKGVRAVVNNLTVKPAIRADAEILGDVKQALLRDPATDSYEVLVQVQDGVVTLTGTVESWQEHRLSAEVAKGVKGVKEVQNEISIDQATPYTPQTDQEIAQAIHTAFQYDPRLTQGHPEVEVENGVGTLTGVVDHLAAKHAAAEDARNTMGVWHVRNYVRVRPGTLANDAELVKDVRAALTRDPYVERYGVQVTALNGQVYLTGTVTSLFEKTRAEQAAAGVPGVISVVNTIQVLSTDSQKQDWEIQYDIQQELSRDAVLDGDKIAVSVQDGVATLTGTVATRLAHSAAINNAYEGGAVSVRDHLQVTHGASGS